MLFVYRSHPSNLIFHASSVLNGEKACVAANHILKFQFFFERCGPDRLYTCREDSSAALLINRICYQDSRYADWELLNSVLIYYGFSSNSFPFFLLFGLGLRQFIWGPALFASHSRGNQGNFAIAYYFALIAWILYCIDGIYLFWICNDKFWSRPINFLPKARRTLRRVLLLYRLVSANVSLLQVRHCCWFWGNVVDILARFCLTFSFTDFFHLWNVVVCLMTCFLVVTC